MLQDSSGEDPFHLTQQTQEGCYRTPEERILSIRADSADSGWMLQDSRGEDPFHLTQQTQEGCFSSEDPFHDSADSEDASDSREDPFHLTQQTQEGCFRTPVERILSI
ncbi:hypothetical protein CgunFtcFv8_010138 [Champsocephalus gunnari]|uniref:Uncharacterized protein n=1 Tax=Champsocephalus gunnari TaxID=52237 RepID=A0AAN8HZ66_CHAGU|nr:hypothetical protein CgunFtcFv8_010138 [Champsocephalus gunnari]